MAYSALANGLRLIAVVIDQVNLLEYITADAHVRETASGPYLVPHSSATVYYLREAVPDGCDQPLPLAFWEAGP